MFLRSPAGGEAATGEGNMSEMFCLIVFVFCFHWFSCKFGKWQKTAVGIMNRGLALLFRAGPCGKGGRGEGSFVWFFPWAAGGGVVGTQSGKAIFCLIVFVFVLLGLHKAGS